MKTMDLLPADRYSLVYNGVDLSRVKPDSNRGDHFRERFGIPHGKILVVQVSWIIPEKGVGDLLRVAQLVSAKSDNVHFAIIGEGPYREQYMKESEAMGLQNTISWTGLIKDPFGEGVFDAADIVCQLSRWEEVFGWMIAEAMAYGKPIVATCVGGIPELVTDETGFLVAPDDISAASEAVLRFAQSPELRSKLGRGGKEKIESNFALRERVGQLIGVYGIQ
jgi:glycosyltransferase involved in cell wall biosynthesis